MVINQSQLNKVVDLIDDKKGKDIVILNLQGISIITDYFLIASGNSTTQIKAISDHLVEKLPELGITVLRKEGLPEAQWVLIDCGDIIIHLMTPETRDFYSLERLWGDAQAVVF